MRRLCIVIVLVTTATLMTAAPPASAHFPHLVVVPAIDASRPAPVANGGCGPAEYPIATGRTLVYRPRYNENPVLVRMLRTPTDLYLCAAGLPTKPDISRAPEFALRFDRAHDGGRVLDDDDVVFAVNEEGRRFEYRGTGSATPNPVTPGDWQAASSGGEINWTAEFRIPLPMVEPTTRTGSFEFVGFSMSHGPYRTDTEFFTWPAPASPTVPDTWADLLFGGARTTVADARLDIARITQGLEVDPSAGVFYERVTRKDTTLRAQLYTLGPLVPVEEATCVAELPGRLRSVTTGRFPTGARVAPAPAGFFNGSPTVDCLFPGSTLSIPGTYRFTLNVRLQGGGQTALEAGTAQFFPTEDLTVMLAGWVFPTGHPEHLPWNDALTASGNRATASMTKGFPVASGVSPFSFNGRNRTPGTRFAWHPDVHQCTRGADEPMDEAVTKCYAHVRGYSDFAMKWHNFHTGLHNAVSDPDIDQFLVAQTFVSTPNNGGGRSCGSDRAAQAGLDTDVDGQNGFVMAQELAHCFGLVPPGSPNALPGNESHSRNAIIATPRGPLLRNGVEEPRPQSVLFPTFSADTRDSKMILEGFEWNALRRTLLARPVATFLSSRSSEANSTLRLTLIESGQTLTVEGSARVDADLTASRPDPNGEYVLLLLNSAGDVVQRHPFSVEPPPTHHNDQHSFEGVGVRNLVVSAPEGAATMEILRGTTSLWKESRPATAPAPFTVEVARMGDGSVRVAWDSKAAEGEQLLHNVFFDRGDGSPRQLLDQWVQGNEFLWDRQFQPATHNGTIIVEASDGWLTTTAESKPFAIDPVAPVVAIDCCLGRVVEGDTVQLQGVVYDPSGEPAKVSWGEIPHDPEHPYSVQTSFKPGKHTVTLTATGPTGLTGSDTITIEVAADSDGDRLADDVESKYACVKVGTADDEDADADNLFPWAELVRGTDPCAADTDGDGMADGDEVSLGLDPLDPASVLNGQLPFSVHARELDLGTCTSTVEGAVEVSATRPLRVATDAEWITAKISGDRLIVTADCRGMQDFTHDAHVLVSDASSPVAHVLSVRFRAGAAAGCPACFDGNPATTERIAGSDAIHTAIKISQARFPSEGATHAVLARSDAFADSLGGTALTGTAPLLLSPSDTLPASVRDELTRVLPAGATVYLLGGPAALSANVEKEVAGAGFAPRRLAGPSRVETAIAVADEVRRLQPDNSEVVLARANSPADNPTAAWADSVTGGGWAAETGTPVLLTPSDAMHPAVAAWIKEHPPARTVLLGGSAALSAAVEQAAPNAQRIAGAARPETAAQIASRLWGELPERRYVIINGFVADGWAYGLPAAGIAADADAPILVVHPDLVPDATRQLVSACNTPQVDLLLIGGPGIIAPERQAELDAADGAAC